MNRKLKLVLVMSLIGMNLLSAIPVIPAQASPLYINLNVSVSPHPYATKGDSVTVTATAAEGTSLTISIDGIVKADGINTEFLSYTFTVTKFKKYHIYVTARNFDCAPSFAESNYYVRTQFPIPSGKDPTTHPVTFKNWWDRAKDYARSYGDTSVWDVTYKILKKYHSTSYIESGISVGEIILKFSYFARDYLNPYWMKDTSSRTAAETTVIANMILEDQKALTMDCTDYSAFFSGMATAIGIPSRIITIDYNKDNYRIEHCVTELYGYNPDPSPQGDKNNNGWFLIDAGGSTFDGESTPFVSSSSNTNDEINAQYSSKKEQGKVDILSFIWGMNSSNWGESITDPERATGWFVSSSPKHIEPYVTNPWGIEIIGAQMIDNLGASYVYKSGYWIKARFYFEANLVDTYYLILKYDGAKLIDTDVWFNFDDTYNHYVDIDYAIPYETYKVTFTVLSSQGTELGRVTDSYTNHVGGGGGGPY